MKKKIVSGILCVAMVASMLVGCGGSNSDSTESGDAEETTEESSSDGMTEGKNTFVDGGTELSLWTFQELHLSLIHI